MLPNVLHNFLEKLLESLIYYTIIWGPWAYGCTTTWAVVVLTISNYSIGLISILIRFIYREPQPKAREVTDCKFIKKFKIRLRRIPIRSGLTILTTIYIVAYLVISILNYRARYNDSLHYFIFNENYVKWLPHTYDLINTVQYLFIFLGFVFFYIGLKTLLSKNQVFPFSRVTKRLLYLITINTAVLVLYSIALSDHNTLNTSVGFGPFVYRTNAASYINIVLPLSVGFLICLCEARQFNKSSIHVLLIPLTTIILIGPIASLSRLGFLTECFILFFIMILLLKNKKYSFKQLLFPTGGVICFLLILVFFQPLSPTLQRFAYTNTWYDYDFSDYIDSFNINFKGYVKHTQYGNDIELFTITNSKKEKYREYSFKAVLLSNSNLQVLLIDHLQGSLIASTIPNLFQYIENEYLDLRVSRGGHGLSVVINGMLVDNIFETNGPQPPTWDRLMRNNKIFVRNPNFSNNSHLDSKEISFSLEPNITSQKSVNSRVKPFFLNHNKFLSWNKLTAYGSDRIRIYINALGMARDFTLLGCGVGAWSSVYFVYHSIDHIWDAWAHNDFIEYFTTLGFFGFLPATFLFILLCFPRLFTTSKQSSSNFAYYLNLSIFACLSNSLFDFPLQVVSIFHIFVFVCCLKNVHEEQGLLLPNSNISAKKQFIHT